MRSPLEAIVGKFEHAIFTTYSISLSFFEQWVLPLLADTGVRNVVVFADPSQLGEGLLDLGAQRTGTAYQAVPVSIGAGVFHPKIMLLTGQASQRLVVSSANLTVSGQLRNLEVVAVLDSEAKAHRTAIAQAAEFIRRVADQAPSHVREAVIAALGPVEPTDGSDTDVAFLHNLDDSIGLRLPPGDITATVPFADRDGRTLRVISLDRGVTCIVDGDNFEAGDGFFTVAEDVVARVFLEPRRRVLHGKAYWSDHQALIGSPNLSEAGLALPAARGNVEAALLFGTEEPMQDPGGVPWLGDVKKSAVARASREREQDSKPHPRAFQAWEEDAALRVEGLPDGAEIDRYTGIGWETYGTVSAGEVVSTDETLRPRLLRSVVGGVDYIAAVHRVVELRIRRTRRMSSRSSEVVHTLPLDLEGVRLLEEVLGELFTLSELAKGDSELLTLGVVGGSDQVEEASLTEWRPAHPGDEPHIPDIYRRSWSKDPDALLALVQAALRLDPVTAFDQLSDFDLRGEDTDLEDVEDLEDDESRPEEETAIPVTTDAVLRTYRGSFRRLLDRGVELVRANRRSVLGDLAFQTLMQKCEQFLVTVEVDGRTEYLVQPDDVRRFRLRVLTVYLKEDSSVDPLCAATARYHLADLIRCEHEWEPLEWETIENLAYRHAATLLKDVKASNSPELVGLTGAAASAWLVGYAARADWLGVIEHASEILSDVDFTLDPFPMIIGTGPVDPFSASPAWECLGYGVIAGTSDTDPYGLAIRSSARGPYNMHILVFDPAAGVLNEAVHRQRDGVWIAREYRPVGRGDLERAGRLGPIALTEANRTSLDEMNLRQLPDLVQPLVRLAEQLHVGGGSEARGLEFS